MGILDDPYGLVYDDDDSGDTLSGRDLSSYRERLLKQRIQERLQNEKMEVGLVDPITPENEARREAYKTDYPRAHQEVFTQSTGIKPFGQLQLESINRTFHVLKHGGRSVIAEPRGFGKTSRTANNALLGILHGYVKYVLILASSVPKAEEILDTIKTELQDNDELAALYPETCACFRQIMESGITTRQTYMGEFTHIRVNKTTLRFPIIEGQPSSGGIIQVRPKDKIRGINIKVKAGEHRGKVLRPDLVFLDDIQTDDEAISPTSVYKIITTLKKSILFAGTHSRPISAVMCCTPICPGDVSSHFILNEPSWDCVVSPMVPQMPDNLELWLRDYARILLDFDRFTTGSRTEARLRARKYVEENYEALHKGSQVAWEWAYAWNEDPQTEISALQHAMNFLIENGEEAFESECQCNIAPRIEEEEGIKATVEEIMAKTTKYKRYHCSLETKYITTHIDVNKDLLTYVTTASPKEFMPSVIDYGTWPPQPGATWKKDDILNTFEKHYKDIPEDHERRYWGIRDLLNKLGAREYFRDDGLIMHNNLILIDMGYSIDEVQRAIRDSNVRSITSCYRGVGIAAKDKPFMERHYEKHAEKHFHCATVPTTDRTLTAVYSDVNYFKTMFHKGIKARPDIGSSVSLFLPERPSEHLLFAKHCIVEVPSSDYYEKEMRSTIIWEAIRRYDNEYFDNVVGTFSGLFKLGCEIRMKKPKPKSYSIQDFLNDQKEE